MLGPACHELHAGVPYGVPASCGHARSGEWESVGCFTGVSPNVSSLEANIPNQSSKGDSDYRQNGEDPQDREDNHEYANEPLCPYLGGIQWVHR